MKRTDVSNIVLHIVPMDVYRKNLTRRLQRSTMSIGADLVVFVRVLCFPPGWISSCLGAE